MSNNDVITLMENRDSINGDAIIFFTGHIEKEADLYYPVIDLASMTPSEVYNSEIPVRAILRITDNYNNVYSPLEYILDSSFLQLGINVEDNNIYLIFHFNINGSNHLSSRISGSITADKIDNGWYFMP